MKLEFFDGTQVEVIAILGGPKLIGGIMRDTLQIEIDPSVMEFNALKQLFQDEDKCRTLYSWTEDVDPETDEGGMIRNTVGEGYIKFISISDEFRTVKCPPGMMLPDTTEELYVVNIAQLTYSEYSARFPEAIKGV